MKRPLLWLVTLATLLAACDEGTSQDTRQSGASIAGSDGGPGLDLDAALRDELDSGPGSDPDSGPDAAPDEADAGFTSQWYITAQLEDAVAGVRLVAYSVDLPPVEVYADAEGVMILPLDGGHTYNLYLFAEDAYLGAVSFPTSDLIEAYTAALVLPLDARGGLGPSSRVADERMGLGPSSKEVFGVSVSALTDEDGVELPLGGLSLDGTLATPENNPNELLDSDLDGVINAEDDDADGDDVPDDLERNGMLPLSDPALPFFAYCALPAPHSEAAPADAPIELWFTEAVDPVSLLGGVVLLDRDEQRTITLQGALLDEGRQVQLTPLQPLRAGGRYALTLQPSLASLQGEPMGRPMVVPFTVESDEISPDPEADALRLVRLSPSHGAEDVALDASIHMAFNRPVADVDLSDLIVLKDSEGEAVEADIVRRGLKVILTPTAPLTPEREYTLRLQADLASLRGLTLGRALETTFTTEAVGAVESVEIVGDDGPSCAPTDEICDALDNDCDGMVDEGYVLGVACEVGQGACLRSGRVRCDDAGGAACDAVAGEPEAELCNDTDDDCDGLTDEDFQARLGVPCGLGLGECRAEGLAICDPDGAGITCSAAEGEASEEICDNLDNDCDGAVDEALTLACGPDTGECVAGVKTCAAGEWGACVGAVGPSDEICDGLDNDCDGLTDEGDTCSLYVSSHCKVIFGHASENDAVGQVRSLAQFCMGTEDAPADAACVTSGGDQRLYALEIEDLLRGEQDAFAIGFICDDPEAPALSGWLQSHCAVYLGHAERDVGAQYEGAEAWDTCPPALVDDQGDSQCSSSGFDGQMRPVQLHGTLNTADDFGVAFRCVDEAAPQRAESVAAAVEVIFGWAPLRMYQQRADDLGLNLLDCDPYGSDADHVAACASTRGDGRFHTFNVLSQVERGHAFGLALRPFRAPPACVASDEICDGRDNDCDGRVDEGAGCDAEQPDAGVPDAQVTDASPATTDSEHLEVQDLVFSDNGNQHCHHIQIINPTEADIDWRVALEIDGSIVDHWRASIDQDSGVVLFEGLDYNNVVWAGNTENFGYCARRQAQASANEGDGGLNASPDAGTPDAEVPDATPPRSDDDDDD